jgi:DNA repair exonuclease SbcCD ATPase subunit|tara:strand:+ start:5015 stop:6727 length:1713 start_codon:yes stop_codon:yes gene_type:complete
MIHFQKIKFKNFLSTGNHSTTIDLDKNTTTLIVGTNGAGKSTFLDALTFALFGKPFRKINKPQLVNSINEKDCLVEVDFNLNGVQWKVVRGIKPNKFEIWKDGELKDQDASAVDQQKWLEQNVLKMNYKSFTQIVILGSSTFVPFMQLTSSNRREVIEDLLDIKIFSAMNEIIKGKLRLLRDSVNSLKIKKDGMSDKVQMQKDFIEELENRGKQNIKEKEEKINQLLNEENNWININQDKNVELESLQNNLEEYVGATEKLRKLGNLKGKISNKVSTITKEHKFFTENTVCPTCTQSIDESFRLNRIEDAQNKAKELQSGYNELEEAIKGEEERERQFTVLSKEITSLTHDISQNNTRISGCQRQVRNLESEIQTITEQLANRNTEHEKLSQFSEELKTITDKLLKEKESIEYHNFANFLLKDGGVKRSIIKKYLPLINQQVNRYLQMMDFYINFTLDDEFNETIRTPVHENFTYSSFSEGEKMRIDLALLFTWREVAKYKNSVNTNLLIMDEVFDSSLDGFGTDDFLKIIRYVIKDANIFVISHKESLHDKFENVVQFEKIKGFSRMVS